MAEVVAVPAAAESVVNPSVCPVEPVAIIGIAGRYPEAADLASFWENLRVRRDCIGKLDETRWGLDGFHTPDPDSARQAGQSYSLACGMLEGFAEFDAAFFGISPGDALCMDPQERLLVQCCWHVLEDAGYTRQSLRATCDSNVGVFVGITRNGHALNGRDLWRPGGPWPFSSGSSAANRISYVLDLKGPSIPIDTMCSSSLTAIHEACAHLRAGECDMAIAGGVNLYLHPSSYVGLCADRMISTDGRTRSFGANGDGFVPGEGVGVVLLKRLSRALEDRDHIHAIVRASCVNHGGGRSMGYATPSPSGQTEVVARALARAGLHPQDVSYVEGHGTATEFGDAIEVSALSRAYDDGTGRVGWCALGSCKPNIGHLEAAAGIAAVTKVVLQMKHGLIVPSLYSTPPNPRLRLETTPFRLQSELAPWVQTATHGRAAPAARIAGVSAFGAAGSNAHVILEDHQAPCHVNRARVGGVIVPLSARDPERLTVKTRDLLKWLEVRLEASDFGIDDVAWTLQMGREAMTARLAVVATGLADAVAELRHRLEEGPTARGSPASRHAVVPWPRTVMDLEDLRAMAEAWEAGGTVDWRALWGDAEPRRIPLPLYPFKPTSYWQRARRGTTPSLDAQTTDRSPDAVVAPDLMLSRIEQFLLEWASQETAIAVEEIATDRTFFELGLRSASLVRMLQGLEDEFGLDVEASVPFEHSTIFDLSRFLVRADVRHGEV